MLYLRTRMICICGYVLLCVRSVCVLACMRPWYMCSRAADALHAETGWVGFPFFVCTRAEDEDASKPKYIRSPEMDTSVKKIQQPPDREAVSPNNWMICRCYY